MKLAAYQFGVSGDVRQNTAIIERAAAQAAEQGAELIVFPECALTGYPPRDIASAEAADEAAVLRATEEIKALADRLGIAILVGTIASDGPGEFYNRAYFFVPGEPTWWYDKRALYGWDEENFAQGTEDGVFRFGEYTIGVRICFEVRFPEYFRELYLAQTDLNIVLFYDVADTDDTDRYQLIRGHLQTRAVENVTPILSVDATKPYQTAPTCYIDASGSVKAECERGSESILFYEFEKQKPTFGEVGRKRVSDSLLGV